MSQPGPGECFFLDRRNEHCRKEAEISIEMGYGGIGACREHTRPVLLWAMGKGSRGELPQEPRRVLPAWQWTLYHPEEER